MLKLMAKMGGAKKHIADNLIGQREVPAAERLGVFLATWKRARWRCKTGTDIRSGSQEGEIDLLAWTPNNPVELLVIEYKASLEAAEIHEVNEVTVQVQDGQEQLRRCIEILAALTPQQKSVIYPFVPWERIRSVYGIVVTSGGTISSQLDYSIFPAITREALLYDLRSNNFMTPRRLWAACRDRDSLDYLVNAESVGVERCVGDLTYFLPGFTYEQMGTNGVTSFFRSDKVNKWCQGKQMGRVDLGGRPPRPPTDPDVPVEEASGSSRCGSLSLTRSIGLR